MPAIPISEFEHRVARWVEHLRKTREPLEITQRGRANLVVMDKETFEEWKADRERLQALEIKVLVEAGERDIAAGRVHSHEQVGKMLGLTPRRSKRKS
jgi:PHD/YefM family antitoxin component YafN of YafNO toxin-antitoxin module